MRDLCRSSWSLPPLWNCCLNLEVTQRFIASRGKYSLYMAPVRCSREKIGQILSSTAVIVDVEGSWAKCGLRFCKMRIERLSDMITESRSRNQGKG